MKLGILGAGMIVKDFLSAAEQWRPESLSLFGRRREAVEPLAERYGMAAFYDYKELLDSGVDTVYVALPNALHYAYGKQALQAGKHVILEKPATANDREFQELAALAKERGLFLFEAMTVHYLPAYAALKKDLKKLGRVRIVSLNYSQYSSRYDRFRAGEVLPAFDPKQAGGALMDLNVYNLHFAAGLFGPPQTIRYCANVERGIDTSGVMLLDYGDFKAVCIGAKDCQAPLQSSIQGEDGSLIVRMPVNRMNAYAWQDRAGQEAEKRFDDGTHPMVYEFREFARIIREEDRASWENALQISAAVSRILREGREQAGIVFPND